MLHGVAPRAASTDASPKSFNGVPHGLLRRVLQALPSRVVCGAKGVLAWRLFTQCMKECFKGTARDASRAGIKGCVKGMLTGWGA